MRERDWARVLAALAMAAPAAAYAEVYLNEEQAAAVLLPGAKLTAGWAELSPKEAAAIRAASGERVTAKKVRVWWGERGQAMIVDRVLGKHEFIDYAVAVSSSGTVLGVEILAYRESYGGQIRGAKWRALFTGKSAADPLKPGADIPSISGATLSSVHVTAGVRRVLHTYELLRAKR